MQKAITRQSVAMPASGLCAIIIWGRRCLVAIFSVLICGSVADAQDVPARDAQNEIVVSQADVRELPSDEAVRLLRSTLESDGINLCIFQEGFTVRAQTIVSVTGNAVTLRCAGIEVPVVYTFRNRLVAGFDANRRNARLVFCSTRDGVPVTNPEHERICLETADNRYGRYPVETLRRFITAWMSLTLRAGWPIPEPDQLRQRLTNLAPPSPEREEQLRRIQVQVDLAIREDRLFDARRLYYDALMETPNWADGQYNYALICGELEFFSAAITGMRAYLVLRPDASDARAAQDKIYEWEARMLAVR